MHEKQEQHQKRKKRFKCSMITIVLAICIIELVVSAVQNISKTINYSAQIHGLENKKNEELIKNKQLKNEIENYNSATTLESIARNNLKMAGKDEILIIINKPEKTEEIETEKKDKKRKK